MDLSEPLKNQGPCPEELRNLTAENFVSPDKHARGKLTERAQGAGVCIFRPDRGSP